MKPSIFTLRRTSSQSVLAAICAVAIGPGDAFAFAWSPAPVIAMTTYAQTAAPAQQAAPADVRLSADQLDSLVAPIALYPDPLLAQTLAASTYPLEVMQLQQWLAKNPNLQGQALATAVARQPWDPSVQAMAALPDVVKTLADNVQWTTDLGNAFLAQESDVMDAVQRMRQRAEAGGKLESSPQQVIDRKVVNNETVITIEPANPQTVYVPVYNPAVVWGATPVYPWPPIYYPSASSYWTGAAIGFGTGIAIGAFWGSGGWGWRPSWGWGHNNVVINRNAAFIRNNNFYRSGNVNTWRHNSVHRGGVAYGNRTVAGRYGGANYNRAAGARQQINRQGGVATSGRSYQGNINRGAARNYSGQYGNLNRGSVNRATGTAGRNYSGQYGNRGSVNRAGTTGRSYTGQGQYRGGSVNRGAVGTTGSFNRGNYSGRSFNRGNYSGRSFNRGSYGGGRSFGGGGRSFGGGGRSFGGGGGRRGGGGRGGRR
jgi:uncharacterized protein DUF3300